MKTVHKFNLEKSCLNKTHLQNVVDVVDATVKATTRLDQVFLVYVDRHIHSVDLQRVLAIVGPLIAFPLDGIL